MTETTPERRMWPLVAAMCAAEIASMAGISTFAALLPDFITLWSLSNTEAGWISGLYFAGYMGAVPVLVSLTDRVDPRRIYLASTLLAAVVTAAFAVAADGFWSASILRALAGVGLAGTYMPGLKILSDRIGGPRQSRALALYTASFSIGTGLSFLIAGEAAPLLGWRWAFGIAALGPVIAFLIVAALIPRAAPVTTSRPTARLLDFRPVFRNRQAMGYILAYGVHAWEALGFRAWVVAFLIFSVSLQPVDGAGLLSGTVVAMLISLAGVPASIVGNEFAMRFGRARVAIFSGLISAAIGCAIGFSAPLPYLAVIALLLIYSLANYADSSTLTAGTVAAAQPGLSGATMAVHSCVGFAGGFMGPLVFGMVLDVAGGTGETAAWGLGFASLGLAAALGPLALFLLARPRP